MLEILRPFMRDRAGATKPQEATVTNETAESVTAEHDKYQINALSVVSLAMAALSPFILRQYVPAAIAAPLLLLGLTAGLQYYSRRVRGRNRAY